jgi:hypothetical protein
MIQLNTRFPLLIVASTIDEAHQENVVAVQQWKKNEQKGFFLSNRHDRRLK